MICCGFLRHCYNFKNDGSNSFSSTSVHELEKMQYLRYFSTSTLTAAIAGGVAGGVAVGMFKDRSGNVQNLPPAPSVSSIEEGAVASGTTVTAPSVPSIEGLGTVKDRSNTTQTSPSWELTIGPAVIIGVCYCFSEAVDLIKKLNNKI